MRDTVMPPGTASQTAMPNSASLKASFARISLLRNCRTMSSTHTAGKINRKTAYPVMVSRYFSSIMAHSTIRKSDVRSASFSAMALPCLPAEPKQLQMLPWKPQSASSQSPAFHLNIQCSSGASPVKTAIPKCRKSTQVRSSAAAHTKRFALSVRSLSLILY